MIIAGGYRQQGFDGFRNWFFSICDLYFHFRLLKTKKVIQFPIWADEEDEWTNQVKLLDSKLLVIQNNHCYCYCYFINVT